MNSDWKRSATAVVLFWSLLLVGLPYLGSLAYPHKLHTTSFRGEERVVSVRTNRQAIWITHDISGLEIFKENGKVVTRHYVIAPRAGGLLINAREASADESELLRKFF